ncbi:cysteine-rich receptor-like protein kinase 8 [Tanacetum coccineum]
MNCSVEVFYHKLKGLWDELDALEAPYNCTCKFTKAYSMLRHEEKQREVPKQTTSFVPFALNTYRPNTPYVAARNNRSQNTQTQPRRSTFRLGVICRNCNKEGHTKEECYKLVGYPVGHPLHNKYQPPQRRTTTPGNQSSNSQSSSRAVNMTVVHDTPVDSDTSSTHMTTLPPDCSGHDGITTQGILCGGLYILPNPSTSSTSSIPSPTILTSTTKSSMWHARLGHPSTQVLKNIKQLSASETKDLATSCNICPLAKHHALPFVPSLSNATSKFELVHMDVWGPYHHPTLNKCNLFLTIVDDFSRATWTYLLPSKHHVTTTIKHFHSYVHTQFKTQIQKIRTDNGTEFVNSSLTEFFNEKASYTKPHVLTPHNKIQG